MAKITIGERKQQSGYFELDYKFELSIPTEKQAIETTAASAKDEKITETVTTKIVNGVAGFQNNVTLEEIKADLIKRYNEEQGKLESDIKLNYYGISFNGEVWSK